MPRRQKPTRRSKQRRAEISRQENRIDQKETALDRKTEALEKKEEELKKRAAEAEERLAEIDALRAKEMERLETLAGLSQEDAREGAAAQGGRGADPRKGRARCRLRDRPEGKTAITSPATSSDRPSAAALPTIAARPPSAWCRCPMMK